jgi:hypothetical protein
MNEVKEIQCGGFGAHSWYEKNYKHCKNINAEFWCNHCHKAMESNTGWYVNYSAGDDSLYPMNYEIVENSRYSGIKLIGNECIKHFLAKNEYSVYAKKVEAK